MALATVRKFVVALLTAIGIVLTAVYASGVTAMWVTVTLAACNALLVYYVPNARPPVVRR